MPLTAKNQAPSDQPAAATSSANTIGRRPDVSAQRSAHAPLRQHDIAPPLRQLELAAIELAQAQRNLDRAVVVVRDAGASWRQIGELLGITPQAAHQRWSTSGRRNHRAAQANYRKKGSVS